MKKIRRFRLRSIILTAALSVVLTLGAVALTLWLLLGTQGLAVATGALLINTGFVGEYDKDAMADAALDSMVESLGDRWSYFANAETYKALKERRNNSYVGIGMTVTYWEDGVHIQEVTEGGPAEKAGLRPGEIIVAADGQDLTGENAQNASYYIQGEAGTGVVLTVLDEQGSSREVTVKRARLRKDPVTAGLLENNVGYVRLDNFYSGSADHVKAAVERLTEQGATSLLFDMRDNPGGYVSELTDLLDYLLPEGPIFCRATRLGPKRAVKSDADCIDLPMAVLINQDSYSAAELFAAQLRESVNAPLIGRPTFGKGYSQHTFWLPGGRGLNLSTKTYYTGAGVSLIGVGLTPDVDVELTGPEDNQLAAAVQTLIEHAKSN